MKRSGFFYKKEGILCMVYDFVFMRFLGWVYLEELSIIEFINDY